MCTINSFIMIVFILFSCQKNDINVNTNTNNNNDTLVIYAYGPVSIDLNNDNITDFIIEYMNYGTDDIPQSSSSIIGTIRPENNNKMLYKAGYLFLEKGDTITVTKQSDLQWFGYPASIVKITWNINNGWDSTWTVVSKKEAPYYLAFILNYNQIDYLGWMELSISSFNGKIVINDYFYKESETIIVGNK